MLDLHQAESERVRNARPLEHTNHDPHPYRSFLDAPSAARRIFLLSFGLVSLVTKSIWRLATLIFGSHLLASFFQLYATVLGEMMSAFLITPPRMSIPIAARD